MYDDEKLNQTIQLKDGRNLGFSESGDLNGTPYICFHGQPGSRYEVLIQGDKPKKLGLHVFCVERPGIGLSDFQPKRKLLDWPDDIVQLADHLGLDKFIVGGGSGGGPYAAVCAYKIPHRLKKCVIIGGMGPYELSKKGMMFSNRLSFFIARWFPSISKKSSEKTMRILNDPDNAKEFMSKVFKSMAEPDRIFGENPELLEIFITEFKEAFRSGPNGVAYDTQIYLKPWGFKLNEISPKLQVYLWHGGLDINVPVSMGKEMCKLIPNCKGFFPPDEGHLSIFFNKFEEIVKIVTRE